MATLINDPNLESRLRAERERTGADRYDEVWERTYMMSPLADDEHQGIQSKLVSVFQIVLGWDVDVRAGVNVSDREEDWEHNYRCPDVAVFLPGTAARNCGTHWLGGPDFAVEILSPYDRSRDKIPFYAAVGVRELLLIDRNPWALELYRRDPAGGALPLAARSTPGDGAVIASTLLPLTFRLADGTPRPPIVLTRPDTGERWNI
jgi:Uma2 family endonuclease